MKLTKYQQLLAKVAELESKLQRMEQVYDRRIHQLREDRVHKRRERIADALVIAILLWGLGGMIWAFNDYALWLAR